MIQSLQRALGVLEVVANNHAPMGSTEISRKVGLHPSTTHHLLQTLTSRGYLAQDEQTREYYVGSKVFQVAALAWNEANLLKLAAPTLADVAQYSGETSHLSLITQNEITVIHKVEGKDPIRVSARVGYPSPAHCTANGKILLSSFPKDQLKEFLTENELRPFTPNSVTSIELLERELSRVRAQGYAVDNQEFKIGVRCIAAPLRNFTGQVIAAIGITGPAWRMTEDRMPDLAEYLTSVARRLSRGLGYAGAAAGNGSDGRSPAGPRRESCLSTSPPAAGKAPGGREVGGPIGFAIFFYSAAHRSGQGERHVGTCNRPIGGAKTNVRWNMFLLLLLLVTINYIDRAALSVAMPLISKEFSLSPAMQGLLLSCFFWTYLLMQIPGGMLSDKFKPRVVIAGATIFWGAFQGLAGVCTSFVPLVLTRLGLGAAEGPIFPAGAKLNGMWMTPSERGRGATLFDSGAPLGAAFGALIITWLITALNSWRMAFVIAGIGTVLAGLWSWFYIRNNPREHKGANEAEFSTSRRRRSKRSRKSRRTRPAAHLTSSSTVRYGALPRLDVVHCRMVWPAHLDADLPQQGAWLQHLEDGRRYLHRFSEWIFR